MNWLTHINSNLNTSITTAQSNQSTHTHMQTMMLFEHTCTLRNNTVNWTRYDMTQQ